MARVCVKRRCRKNNRSYSIMARFLRAIPIAPERGNNYAMKQLIVNFMEVAPMAVAEERARRGARWIKLLRRAHMYAGLGMLPWILFFGISGLLFNHPNVGEDVRGERVDAAQLRELGFAPWDAARAAQRVVDALNGASGAGARPFALDDTFESQFSGFGILSAKADAKQYMLLLDVESARGVLAQRAPRRPASDAVFPQLELPLPELSMARVEEQLSGLLRARGAPAAEALRAHPKIAPELRLRVRDARGVHWNLTYDTRSGSVSGRKSEAWPNLGFAQALAKLHTTHHFPLRVGPLWFWALFEDLLGLTMVFWAVSGLVMWWKIKPTRLIGALSVSVALGIAALIMAGTLDHLLFGDVRAPLGPGE